MTYDAVGNRLTVSDGTVSVVQTFDDDDRLASQEIPHINRTVTFDHDLSGLRTALRINGGSPQTYGWDLNSRLAVRTGRTLPAKIPKINHLLYI